MARDWREGRRREGEGGRGMGIENLYMVTLDSEMHYIYNGDPTSDLHTQDPM